MLTDTIKERRRELERENGERACTLCKRCAFLPLREQTDFRLMDAFSETSASAIRRYHAHLVLCEGWSICVLVVKLVRLSTWLAIQDSKTLIHSKAGYAWKRLLLPAVELLA